MALPIVLTTQQGNQLRTRLNTLTGNGGCVWGSECFTSDETPISYYVGIVDNDAKFQFYAYADKIEIYRHGKLTWLSTADTSALITAIGAKETTNLNAELLALLT